MDKFQVYNRKLNRWEEGKLVSGWSENFVLDKTTDSAKVKVKIEGTATPDWNNGDWCRILHLGENEIGATYTRQNIRILTKNNIFARDSAVTQEGVRHPEIEFKTYYSPANSFSFNAKITYTLVENGTASTQTETITITMGSSGRYVLTDYDYDVLDSFTLDFVEYSNVSPKYIQVQTSQAVFVPKNHEQFIIKNINSVVDSVNDEIDIQLTLGEPIEIAQGILCETMSFTNQVEKIVDGITYSHEPLTHLSVLEKTLKVTPANNDDYTWRDNNHLPRRKTNNSWYNRIIITDEQTLGEVPFNDETYNEPTLYEILLNKFDSSIGKTPVLYFDIDSSTDKPRNIDRAEYFLQFERQDGFDKDSINFEDLKNEASQIVFNQDDENFADGLISNYDNLAPNKSLYLSAENIWSVAEYDDDNRQLTGHIDKQDKWILRTPHMIKKVISIRHFYADVYGYYFTDITDIFEEKEYKANANYGSANADDYVWYAEGSNKIFLNGMKYRNLQGSWGTFDVYKVEYEPLVSGRFDLGKDYQIQINQNDNQIDSKKFGDYLKEYFKSMNKTDITITKTIEDWQDVVEIGTRVIKDNKNYIITNVSVEKRMFDYTVTYQLNENHVRKNTTVQAPQEIRKNIEIGIDATKERKSMLSGKAKISLSATNFGSPFGIKKEILFSPFATEDYRGYVRYPQIAYLTLKSKYPFVSGNSNKIDLLCELARFSVNNTICFNLRYFDNADAGKKKELDEMVDAGTFYHFGSPNKQIPVLYTDIFGEFDELDLKLIIRDSANAIEILEETGYSYEKYKDAEKEVNSSARYPYPTYIETSTLENPVASVSNIKYYKDMLDTFNYTIGVHYESDENIILCEHFFKDCSLMSNENIKISKIQTFNTNINENDYKTATPNEEVNIDYAYVNTALSEHTINIFLDNSATTTKSVCLVDENDNPLLIINDYDKHETNPTFNTITLYC